MRWTNTGQIWLSAKNGIVFAHVSIENIEIIGLKIFIIINILLNHGRLTSKMS